MVKCDPREGKYSMFFDVVLHRVCHTDITT
jgi:hypothetical protein